MYLSSLLTHCIKCIHSWPCVVRVTRSQMSSTIETQRNTLETFIDGWKGWTPEGMMSTFSDDCTQSALPFTMHQPRRNIEDMRAVLPRLMGVVDNYQVWFAVPSVTRCVYIYTIQLTTFHGLSLKQLKIHNVVHDTASRKAAVYAISKGDTPFGDWDMEYAVFVEFNEHGDKITKLEEMLDSAFMKEFAPKFHSFMAQNPELQRRGS